MAMSKNKTTETKNSVKKFISSVPDKVKQADCYKIIEIMEQHSGFKAKMWGPAIVGFGSCHYKYESGREGDMPQVAFSPRKAGLVFYLSSEFDKREQLLKEFGKHKLSKACIYVKKLDDINIEVLKKMIGNSLKHTRTKYK